MEWKNYYDTYRRIGITPLSILYFPEDGILGVRNTTPALSKRFIDWSYREHRLRRHQSPQKPLKRGRKSQVKRRAPTTTAREPFKFIHKCSTMNVKCGPNTFTQKNVPRSVTHGVKVPANSYVVFR